METAPTSDVGAVFVRGKNVFYSKNSSIFCGRKIYYYFCEFMAPTEYSLEKTMRVLAQCLAIDKVVYL